MTDGIIKGTGNSWNLKSVANFMSLYPTYEDFAEALISGEFPIDLNGMNDNGWTQMGTPLNKANLLSDETATALGLTGDATVDGALGFLGQENTVYHKLIPYMMPSEFIQVELPYNTLWQAVGYGDGMYVAIPMGETEAAYSRDGIHWEPTTIPSKASWMSVTYGNGKFVTVAMNSNRVAYSTDGITWEQLVNVIPGGYWCDITFGNGKFVIISSDKALYSTDGTSWNEGTLPNNISSLYSVTYGNGKFVAVYNGGAVYSEDGITWGNTEFPHRANLLTYGNGKFLAVSSDGTVIYSEDGIRWEKQLQVAKPGGWRDIAYGAGKFVITSSGTIAAYSTDGIHWKEATLPSSGSWNCLTFGNGGFVTLAYSSNKAAYSDIIGLLDTPAAGQANVEQLRADVDYLAAMTGVSL